MALKLSVIIPAYNEGKTLPTILKRVMDVPVEKERIMPVMGKRKNKKERLLKPEELHDTFIDCYGYFILSGILFLSLIIRITALADLLHSIYFDFLLWDERVYHE